EGATLATLRTEYGGTAGTLYIDQQTIQPLKPTGREPEQVALVESYAKAAGFWADSLERAEYERVLEFDLPSVARNLAGPS
uniref:aconitase family protein n=1 Tax=Vibrio cholerae TaxID=666 RepID=UPI001C0FE5D4